MENRRSMVKVEDLEVFYGGIQAIHGISWKYSRGDDGHHHANGAGNPPAQNTGL